MVAGNHLGGLEVAPFWTFALLWNHQDSYLWRATHFGIKGLPTATLCDYGTAMNRGNCFGCRSFDFITTGLSSTIAFSWYKRLIGHWCWWMVMDEFKLYLFGDKNRRVHYLDLEMIFFVEVTCARWWWWLWWCMGWCLIMIMIIITVRIWCLIMITVMMIIKTVHGGASGPKLCRL